MNSTTSIFSKALAVTLMLGASCLTSVDVKAEVNQKESYDLKSQVKTRTFERGEKNNVKEKRFLCHVYYDGLKLTGKKRETFTASEINYWQEDGYVFSCLR